MREIKFRAWDVREKEFLSIKSMGICDDGSVWYVQAIDENEKDIDPPYFPDNPEDVLIMQYTGLKDIDGFEIYEDDILGKPGWVVSYVDGSDSSNLGLPVGWYEQRNDFESYRQLEVGDALLVIGNIHENPELLN